MAKVRAWLPRGSTLPDEVWARRHRAILALLWLHVPGLFLFGLARGETVLHTLSQTGVVAFMAVVATVVRHQRRNSTVWVALGLFTCSAVLVHLSGGYIEMHFHYFVMVGVVTLYQDWRPFLTAIGYVVLQHGVAGAFFPSSVYNHEAAVEHPWQWAGVHGLFVLGLSAAGIASWRLNEALLERTAERQEMLAEAQEVAKLGSWEWHVPTGQVTWSDQLYAIVGVEPRSFTPSYESFFSRVHPEDRDVLAQEVHRAVQEGGQYARDFRVTISESDLRWVHGRGEVKAWDQGAPVVMAGTVQDITDRKRLEDDLLHQALHDSLTGLANQALFRNRVEHAMARAPRRRTGFAVLFLDLDNFKTVNDSLGHSAGDEVVVAVARRLEERLRNEDTTARLGGDEFAVLLEDLGTESHAGIVADRLIAALNEPFRPAGREFFVSASVGIAHHETGMTSDQLLRNADLAMYHAKTSGKGRAQVFEAGMHAAAVERLNLEADLRRALDAGQLSVHYQPIVVVGSGAISSVEALVRWQHPERGLLPPGTFVPLAEETGLIQELGRQVLNEACRQVRRWQLEHPRDPALAVSVNLSPGQLAGDSVVEDVRAALAVSEIRPSALVLEITEGSMKRDTGAAIEKLGALKALGVRLAVDDFGIGYASLIYLQHFPVDMVKIDRSFVASMGSGAGTASVPQAIVSLAQNLSLHTVAEGVETQGQLDMLARLGCDFAQGYHLARPLDPESLEQILSTGQPIQPAHRLTVPS
jgi:diguanylate cyclase (GGDEF)-like protein